MTPCPRQKSEEQKDEDPEGLRWSRGESWSLDSGAFNRRSGVLGKALGRGRRRPWSLAWQWLLRRMKAKLSWMMQICSGFSSRLSQINLDHNRANGRSFRLW